MIKVHGRLEDGKRCYTEMKCAIDGCERMPTRAWLVVDTRMDDDGLYILCSAHDEVTFIYPATGGDDGEQQTDAPTAADLRGPGDAEPPAKV